MDIIESYNLLNLYVQINNKILHNIKAPICYIEDLMLFKLFNKNMIKKILCPICNNIIKS